MSFAGGRRDLQAGVAAEGTEQDADGFLNVDQFDHCFREMSVSGLGDPVVPEFSDKFFHDLQFPAGVFVGV